MNAAANRILVVDNETTALSSVRELLRQQGYAVAAAENAVQASDLLKQQQFAAVLASQQTPVLTGLEFLAEVKKVQPDASLILMTASLTPGTAIEAINKVEIYRLIHRPWRREDLLAVIRSAVERYETVIRNRLLLATTTAMNETLTKLNRSLEMNLAEALKQKDSRP